MSGPDPAISFPHRFIFIPFCFQTEENTYSRFDCGIIARVKLAKSFKKDDSVARAGNYIVPAGNLLFSGKLRHSEFI